MPELHKLTPALGVLMDRGHRVALVTDGRMSGASGKVPAALHCTPEAAAGGPLSRLRDGDVVRVDAESGRLEVDVDLSEREPWIPEHATHGTGRELFAAFRERVGRPDEGASVFADADRDQDVRVTRRRRRRPRAGDPGRRHRRRRGRRAAGRGAGARRPAGDRGDAAHATPRWRAIERIAAEVEGAVVGAGTVTTTRAARRCAARRRALPRLPGRDAHAARRACRPPSVPFLPGTATASDMVALIERGITHAKLFPAEVVGGVKALKAFAGPFPQMRFCPTGGINAANAPDYLALPNVACVGGSWMVPAATSSASTGARREARRPWRAALTTRLSRRRAGRYGHGKRS